ncbi:hypothetical protein ILYODFUR_015721 [Ilyodon furcidens]|uniref:Uncharacterized protein n=1 Tax=Ilyodon furcidens TaxID=33524 RepID=A0ABV0UJ73_9TELE
MDVFSTSFIPLFPSSSSSSSLSFSQSPSAVHLHPPSLPLFFFLIGPLSPMACPLPLPYPSLLLLHKLPVTDSGHIAFVHHVLVCLWEPQQPGPGLNEPTTMAH